MGWGENPRVTGDDRMVTGRRDLGERWAGVEITPDLLRAEADHLDGTPATGPVSWLLGEVAELLRLTARVLADPCDRGTDG